MIDRKTARWMGLGGATAALLSGLGSMLIAFLPAFNPIGFGEALLFLGLAVGIYFNSRICAVGALLYFVTMRLEMYPQAAAAQAVQGGGVMLGFWMSVLLFTALYALAVVGTFATASLPPVEPRPPADSFREGSPDVSTRQPQEPDKKKKRVKTERARGICGACSGVGQLPETKLPCAWCDGKGYV